MIARIQQGFNSEQLLLAKFWFPALLNGLLVWVLFLVIGQTPLLRASGLALVIVGMTLALRRMGSLIAIIGGLSLALSPHFWSQTGGGIGSPATIVIALGVALVVTLLSAVISKRPYIGFGLGIIVFALFFWSQIGTARSIRLTGFVIGWAMFLLVDMLLLTNPRPEDAPLILRAGGLKALDGRGTARPYHTWGLLVLMAVGIINDPLVIILMPAILLSLLLTRTSLNRWYWLAMLAIFVIGLRAFWLDYWLGQGHLFHPDYWRLGTRWIALIKLMITQFTIFGCGLSLLGLARFARWYPPIGTVSMVGFAAYWLLGLVYTNHQQTLLLPMYFIFVMWMSYAVLALSEWAAKTFAAQQAARYVIILCYGLLPAWMLWQIISAA